MAGGSLATNRALLAFALPPASFLRPTAPHRQLPDVLPTATTSRLRTASPSLPTCVSPPRCCGHGLYPRSFLRCLGWQSRVCFSQCAFLIFDFPDGAFSRHVLRDGSFSRATPSWPLALAAPQPRGFPAQVPLGSPCPPPHLLKCRLSPTIGTLRLRIPRAPRPRPVPLPEAHGTMTG